jgi:beta-galactosidase
VTLAERSSLFAQLDALSVPVRSTATATMEQLGQSYGFIMYSTELKGPRERQKLHIRGVHDRALAFLDGRPLGVIERWNHSPLDISVPAGGARLDILVENMGRINYGPLLRDPKGITGGVLLDNQYQFGWTIRPLPLAPEELAGIRYVTASAAEPGPAFYRGHFEAAEIGDTFLRLDGWGKGVAWINGFNLGRYWEAGPQRTLYVPGPLLRQGRNEIVLFEQHQAAEGAVVTLTDRPDLGIVADMDQSALHFVADDAEE